MFLGFWSKSQSVVSSMKAIPSCTFSVELSILRLGPYLLSCGERAENVTVHLKQMNTTLI